MVIPQGQPQGPTMVPTPQPMPVGFPSTFSEALTKGKHLPDDYKTLLFGFDFEIQLADLDNETIDYLNTAFEEASFLAIKILNMRAGLYSDTDPTYYKNELDAINTEVKVVVRASRGKGGFWVREAGTVRSQAENVLEQRGQERRGFLRSLLRR